MKTNTLKRVRVYCESYYTTDIEVPEKLTRRQAWEYAKKHIDEIPVGELTYVENTDNIDDNDYDNSYLVNEHGEPIGDNDVNTKGPYRTLIKAIAETLCHYNSDKIDLVYNDEYLAIMYHSQYNSFLIENVCNKNDIDENIVIEIADGFNIGHAF